MKHFWKRANFVLNCIYLNKINNYEYLKEYIQLKLGLFKNIINEYFWHLLSFNNNGTSVYIYKY